MIKPNGLRLIGSMLLFVLGSFLVTAAIVKACNDGATSTEILWANGRCNQTMINDYYQAWDLTDDSWDPAGLTDDCNINKPFAKVINAIALINVAPNGGAPAGILGPFHDRVDYVNESRSTNSSYHSDFYLRFIQTNGGAQADSEVGRFAAEDRTNLHCPIFNFPQDAVDETAAVLIHEAWHHWQQAHGFDSTHLNGPTGSCTASGLACDWFYPHVPGSTLPDGTLSSDIGNLNRTVIVNGVGQYFHSPYQIMAEFAADIALWAPEAQTPFSVRQEAQVFGNSRLSSNFKNAVAYQIGIPVPFPGLQPNPNN